MSLKVKGGIDYVLELEEKDLCQLISFQHLSFDPDGKLDYMGFNEKNVKLSGFDLKGVFVG
ncbi:hypothetical protein Ccrd_025470 [Cynara cardunculus var. scolymus]|uniref:Uncharacterized protein n=1 Tax=Cynara cardunculus var. scolymus TaxID=59895 RepID=A0A103X3P4_CYNCS|nr:hypothetical protein Ccrd_025470 [Cynara cardunculus var. scolymus]